MLERMRVACAAAAAALALGAMPAAATAAAFTFAGFAFEQDSTPDQLGLLGNGQVLGGATFSTGTATAITRSVGFQAQSGNPNAGFVGLPGFDPSLSLGRQAFALGLQQPGGGNCLFGCAVNLPSGDQGSTKRHGLEVGWSGGRTLGNGAGDDFVIYESGSPGAAEGYMVRLRLADGSYTDWRFEVADGFQAYTQTPTATADGAFATAFDLSDFGLSASDAIDLIQIANLFGAGAGKDRIDASGRVHFDGTTGTPYTFGSSAVDPDPLYVGVLHALNAPTPMPEPTTLSVVGLGLAGLALLRRRRRRN